jgi:hypothetical protein
MLCEDQVLVCTPDRCGNRGDRLLLHWPLPPPPQNPVTDKRTDKAINILDLEFKLVFLCKMWFSLAKLQHFF